MTFGAPHWLFLLLALPLLALGFVGNERRADGRLERLVAPRLRSALTASVSRARRRTRFVLLLAALACLILSMAQPRSGYTWERVERKGRDVLIAIDTSRSMDANDLTPSRLARAKFAVQDLIGLLPGDRVGLIAFAGTAFLQAPLTIDYSAVLTTLQELDTDIIPQGGTNIAAAIEAARAAFGKGESQHRALILFSDGEELLGDAVQKARAAAGAIRIFTVGVGTPDGALVPARDEKGGTTFVKDPQGNFVKSRLDEPRLREIAQAGGGFYLRLTNGPADMKTIVERGLQEMTAREIQARESQRPIERYQWPLAAGILLLMLWLIIPERRQSRLPRAWLVPLAACLLLAAPADAGARLNPGVTAYEKGDYQRAYDAFAKELAREPRSPVRNFNFGTAAYRLGKEQEALEAFGKALLSSDPKLRIAAEMNLGHTLYRSGEKALATDRDQAIAAWRQSIAHYDEALKIAPDNQEIQGYRKFVQNKLEELEKQAAQDSQKTSGQPRSQQREGKQDAQSQPSSSSGQDGGQGKNASPGSQNEPAPDTTGQDQQSPTTPSDPDQTSAGETSSSPQTARQPAGGEGQTAQQPDAPPAQLSQAGEAGSQDTPSAAQNPATQPGSTGGAPLPDAGAEAEPTGTAPRELSGEIKARSEEKPGQQPPAAAAVVEAKPGEMTREQASMLLDSLRSDDANVSLRERKGAVPVLRDW